VAVSPVPSRDRPRCYRSQHRRRADGYSDHRRAAYQPQDRRLPRQFDSGQTRGEQPHPSRHPLLRRGVSSTVNASSADTLSRRTHATRIQGHERPRSALRRRRRVENDGLVTPATRSPLPPKSRPTWSSPTSWNASAPWPATPAVTAKPRGRGRRKRRTAGWASLTPTEHDVVRLVSEGLANKDIAKRLFISPRTVQTHLTHVYTKLGVSGRVQLVQEAARHT
jgi:DNA-binding CsgD family transcriptional regulator